MPVTRALRCAIPLDVLTSFRADCAKHGFVIIQEDRKLNGSIFLVDVPVRQADLFATWVNSNWGDML